MPTTTLEYPKLPFNTVNRYSSRASYALETIHHIINTCPLLHVSFLDPKSPFPALLPLIGQLGSFSRPSATEADVLDLYLHSYVSARIVNLAREAGETPTTATTTTTTTTEDGPSPKGLPVTIAASHVDGFVLALTPNAHSYNYRSATLFGHATVVTDPEEKLYAMELMTNGVVPGRWRNSRVPPSGKELASTAVLRVRVRSGSAKLRAGSCSDDACDLEDEGVVGRVWAGVVPVYQVVGEPVAAPYNRVAEVPEYVGEFVEEGNKVAKERAVEAARAK